MQDVINRDGRKICIVTYTPKEKALKRLEKIRYRKERNPGFVLSSGTYYIDAETKVLLQIDYEFENKRNKQSSLVAFSGKYIFERINEKLFPVYALMKNEFFDDSIKYVSRHELFLSGHINLDINVKEIETKYDVLFQRRNDVFDNPPFLSPSDFFVNINKSIKDNYGPNH